MAPVHPAGSKHRLDTSYSWVICFAGFVTNVFAVGL
jgi:hypothetical protein